METGKSSHQNGTTGFKPELGDSGLPLGEKYPVDDGKESPVSNDNLLQEDTASDTETGLLDGSPQLSKDFKMDSQECVDGDTPDEVGTVYIDPQYRISNLSQDGNMSYPDHGSGDGNVTGLELVGPSKRRWTGYGVMAFWSLGMIILAPIAFFIRDWHYLQLATSLLPLPLLSYWWLIPESPRWLLSKGHVDKAEAIINRAAHANRKTLPAGIMDKISLPGTSHSGKSVLTMCTSKRLVVRYLFIFYIWMVSSLAYYGLSWNVGTLGGSVYVNFLLSGVVELVAIGFCVYALDRVGRRVLNCGLMMLAGVTCTATLFPVLFAPPSQQWITVVLAMAGKLGITGAFNTVWLFSSELFPTVIRNSGIGASSVFARVGGIMAPYIANLGQSIGGEAATAVPLVIFGAAAMIAGVLLLCLPETLNRRLPETVQDAIDMGSFKCL
nr:hypothetical protein BaRGS_004731 [Batillaria attramentaria]